MSYLDDLRTMTYTSPSGKSFVLGFDDVARTGGKKSAIVEPPQQNRAVVQDLGNKGIRFSLSVYISGMDYHTTADAFFVALSEPCDSDSPATLSHPRWGDILVCPEGDFSQVESFVAGMGQAVFTFDLVRVDRSAKFPGLATDAGSQLAADSEAAKATAKAAALSADGPQSAAQMTANTLKCLTDVSDALRGGASQVDDIGTQFEAALVTIEATVDDLVTSGPDLAEALTNLIVLPSSAAISVTEKVASLALFCPMLASQIIDSPAALSLLAVTASATSAATAEATLTGDLENQQDAIDAADKVDIIISAIRAAIEAAEARVGELADRDTVDSALSLLSSTRARLIEKSFDLKSARVTVLPVSMDPDTAVKLLYGTWSDDLLTSFIADNDLEDDEFFMLPAGFEAVWYA